jgi:integrase
LQAELSIEPVDMARIALKRLGLVGKSNERDRRPTEDEIESLLKRFELRSNYPEIPMARVVKFAIATAMRQEEIFRVTWSDFNKRTKMLTIRDRKDPRQKKATTRKYRFLPFRAMTR